MNKLTPEFTALATIAVGIAIGIDWLNAMIVGLPAVFWAYLVYSVFTLLLLRLWCRENRVLWSRSLQAVSTVMVLCVTMLYFMPWNSQKPFLQDLYSLPTGITQAEVERVMGGYTKGTGWSEPPGSEGRYCVDEKGHLALPNSIVYRHSDEAEYNADWGVVIFRDGKVIGVDFYPD